MLKVAASQYSFKKHSSLNDFLFNADAWVKEASTKKARLLVFPEYGSIELVSLLSSEIQKNLLLQLNQMQQFRDDFIECYMNLAKKYKVFIIAPSFPWKVDNNHFVNRAFFFTPDSTYGFQDKQMTTRFEDEHWKVSRPKEKELKIFDVDGIKVAISICFDIEFPDYSRELALKGAQIIVAPSCTESPAGMNRVHIGARARALENQLYVVVSQSVGEVDYSEAIDKNYGRAAIYSTCDKGFPDNGVIAEGRTNVSEWVYAELDSKLINYVREDGSVLNFKKISLL
jgi:predicted amidohydrolase